MEEQICFVTLSKTTFFVLTATFLLLSVNLIHARTLQKRNVIQLCNLIEYHTERSCWDYNNYGCFCGWGQEGSTPLDDVDKCCKEHDACYDTVECEYFYEYPQVDTYSYEWDNETRTSQCVDEYPCYRTVCECDKILSECLASATYNASMKYVDIEHCQDSESIHWMDDNSVLPS